MNIEKFENIYLKFIIIIVASQKKQRMVFQQIRVQPVNEEEQIKEQLERLAENTIHIESKKHKVQDIINSTGLDHPLRFLQAHGITMIPMDNDATIVENAMESGQTVVLTGIEFFFNVIH